MPRKFAELRRGMSSEQRLRSRERAAATLLEMDLAGLRGHVEITQEELASRLEVAQSNVSRLERRQDMLVSTLREVVQACGGKLRVIAEFPEGSVEIRQSTP